MKKLISLAIPLLLQLGINAQVYAPANLNQRQDYLPASRINPDVQGGGQRAIQSFPLDYASAEYFYSQDLGTFFYFLFWPINSHFDSTPPDTTGNFTCKWAAVNFDTLYDYTTEQGYPYPGTIITIDTIGITCNHRKRSLQNDTLIVSVLERANTGSGFTSNDGGITVTNTVLWDTMIVATSSLTPGTPSNQAAELRVPCGHTLPAGTKFSIKLDFKGAKIDTFELADFNRDDCLTPAGPPPGQSVNSSESVFPFNSWRYFNLFFPPSTDLNGITPLVLTGADTTCNQYYFQNWGITAYVTMDVPLSAAITQSQTDVCPGETVALTAIPAGGTPPYTVTWSPTTGLSSPFTATTNATVNATITYTATVRDAVNDIVVKQVTINVNGITINAGSDRVVPCGQSVTILATPGGVFVPSTYSWSNGVVTLNNTVSAAGTYSITATNQFGCTATDAVVVSNSGVNQTLSFDVSVPNNIGCVNGPINFTNTSSRLVNWNWSWNFGNGSMSPAQSPAYTYTQAGNYTVTLTADSAGCQAAAVTETLTIQICSGIVASITGNLSFCQGSSTVLAASYINATGGVTYQWNTGASTQNITVTAAGTYSVTVTDQSSSDSETVTVSTTPLPVANFTFNVSGNSATFSNTSANASTYLWDFGDGNSSPQQDPSHTYTSVNSYTVCLTASNSCGNNQNCQTVPITCTINAAITPPGPLSICNGDSVVLAATTGTGYTYTWSYNGTQISNTGNMLTVVQAGSYAVTISDGNCSVTSPAVNVGLYPPVTVSITATNAEICPGDSAILQASPGFSTYLWSNGAATSQIKVTQSGEYSVTATDANGCQGNKSFSLNTSTQTSPEICLAGVDNATGKNIIVWEKPVTAGIDSYIVYKETAANVYNIIGTQGYSAPATFIDQSSGPGQGANKYKLAIIDSCGSITPQGTPHKTVHLIISQGANTSWNLAWSHYEGFSFSSYAIYRGTDANSLAQITTVTSSVNSYSDTTAPGGTVYYQVEAVKAQACVPAAGQSYSASRSNIVNGGGVGIENNKPAGINLRVYPNPTNSFSTIEIANGIGEYELTIYNMTGMKVVSEKIINGNKFILQKDYLQQGVYFIEARNREITGREKLVIY